MVEKEGRLVRLLIKIHRGSQSSRTERERGRAGQGRGGGGGGGRGRDPAAAARAGPRAFALGGRAVMSSVVTHCGVPRLEPPGAPSAASQKETLARSPAELAPLV